MSVLLFMPESGGNPMESVIMSSEADNRSKFEVKPGRKLSSDSISVHVGDESDDEGEMTASDQPGTSHQDVPNSVDPNEEASPSPTLNNNPSTTTTTATAKRLTPVGALMGASGIKAKSTKDGHQVQQQQQQQQVPAATPRVHLGFYV